MAETLSELVARLRSTRAGIHAKLAAIDDDALNRDAVWRRNKAEVRSLFHRLDQHDEEHLIHLTKTLDAIGATQTEAQRALGQALVTRGELESLLVGLDDDDMDSSPGGEEWPVRRVLGHIAGAEMRLIAETAAALDGYTQPQDEKYLVTRGAQVSGGSFEYLHDQLHRVRSELIERLSSIPDDTLTTRTPWFAWEVDLRFRLLDFASHEREHIVHLIKTLQGINHRKTESQLLVGRSAILDGQLEARLVGLSDSALDKAPSGEWTVRQILEHLLDEDQKHADRILDSVSAVSA
jgi:hypothetical protein